MGIETFKYIVCVLGFPIRMLMIPGWELKRDEC